MPSHTWDRRSHAVAFHHISADHRAMCGRAGGTGYDTSAEADTEPRHADAANEQGPLGWGPERRCCAAADAPDESGGDSPGPTRATQRLLGKSEAVRRGARARSSSCGSEGPRSGEADRHRIAG